MLGPVGDISQYAQALAPGIAALTRDLAPIPEWVHLQQQSGLPPDLPGMVADPERIVELLTNERIIQQHESDVDESRNARQERENEWRLSSDLYNNIGDSAGKAAWQSDVFIPQIYNKTQMALSLVKSSLLETPRWFTLEKIPAWTPETA